MSTLVDAEPQPAPPLRLLAAVAVLALVVYVPFAGNGFTGFDDNLYVTANPRIQSLSWASLARLWSPEDALAGRFIEFFPLRDTLYAAVYAVAGAWAVPYHLLSALLHAVAAMLVVLLAGRLGLGLRAAGAAGALFAVHAVHVEAVAWVAALKDPLHAVLVLGCMLSWLHSLRNGRARWGLVSLVCLAAALMVKASAVVAGPLLVVCMLYARPEVPPRQWVGLLVPHALLSGSMLSLIVVVAKANQVIVPYPGGTAWTGALTSAYSLAVYVSKMLAPVDPCIRYIMAPVTGLDDPRAWWGLLVVALLLGAAVGLRNRVPVLAWACAFYLVALLPVLNILPKRNEVADRYQYIPAVAFCIVAGWAYQRMTVWRPPVAMGLGLTTLALHTALAIAQLQVWASPVRLWEQVTAQPGAPQHSFAYNMLGNARENAGDTAGAVAAWTVATGAQDREFGGFPHANLARVALASGNAPDALAQADAALAINPTLAAAHLIRARALMAMAQPARAMASWNTARALEPFVASTAWNRGVLAFDLGRDAQAAADLADAVRLDGGLCPRLQAYSTAMEQAHPGRGAPLALKGLATCIPVSVRAARAPHSVTP